MSNKNLRRFLAGILALAIFGSLVIFLLPTAAFAAEDTITIHSAEDFAKLARNCALDSWSKGKTVVLKADISLETVDADTVPIFAGTFDGGGHTISGVSISEEMSPAGLFGIVLESAVIKNLKVSGNVHPSGDTVGGIVGKNYGIIQGCTFTGSVEGGGSVGGIVGTNAMSGFVSTCTAIGSVVGDTMTGGICGNNQGTLNSCRNEAYINTVSVDPAFNPEEWNIGLTTDLAVLTTADTSIAASDTGGIAGYSSGILSGCRNTGPVGYPHVGYNVGGIVGRSCGHIKNCENIGNISGRKDVGGIAGQMEPYIARSIEEDTLTKLQGQLDGLNSLINNALGSVDSGTNALAYRLNKIADAMDAAAGEADEIKASGTITGSLSADGETDIGGGITITPPQEGAGGSIEGGIGSSGDGDVSASTTITVTTDLSGLAYGIYAMSSQMRLLNTEVAEISGTLKENISAIQGQINTISDTMVELFRFDGSSEVVIDLSDVDIALVTLGKALSCENAGPVDGDINVGGIAGSLSMESTLDPEDDISGELTGSDRRRFELRAIIQSCKNTGILTAKRSYAGGICGRMDMGLVTSSENYGAVSSESGDYVGGIAGYTASTVRCSFSKCSLSGGRYVGGIVGSGIQEDVNGNCSTVGGCGSMVEIDADSAFCGAIAGADAGDFIDNYFVSDTLTGINGRSYQGKAEPVSYATLYNTRCLPVSVTAEVGEGEETPRGTTIPEEFLELTLTFVADGKVLKTIPFAYGASFDSSIYPNIPKKEGHYGNWDVTKLESLHFDQTVTAAYSPYITALESENTDQQERPRFFVEGAFNETGSATFTQLSEVPADFPVPQRKFATVEILEQWRVSIPEDDMAQHIVRYLPTETEDVVIYLKTDDGWREAETEILGSYLAFPVAQLEMQMVAVKISYPLWLWLAGGGILLTLILLILGIARFISNRKRSKKMKALLASRNADNEETPPVPKKKKFKRQSKKLLIFLILAVLVLLFILLFPWNVLNGLEAYELLRNFENQPELTMELTVSAEETSQAWNFSARVERTNLEDHTITAISRSGSVLYYCDGTVFSQEGDAYRLDGLFPDYAALLDQVIPLYKYVFIEETNGVYTITANGEDAKAIVELLIPSLAALLGEEDAITVELVTQNKELTQLCFSLNGENAPFTLTAALRILPEDGNRMPIPKAITDAVESGDYTAAETLTEDLVPILNGWDALYHKPFWSSTLHLKADCGPITLNEELDFSCWQQEETQIYAIAGKGRTLYFTDSAIYDQRGNILLAEDAPEVDAGKLLDIAYQTCLNGELDCTGGNNRFVYTLSLDAVGMETVACAIAPEAQNLNLDLTNGSIQVIVQNDVIQSITLRCSGDVQVITTQAGVSFEAKLEFDQTEAPEALPEEVTNALTK